MMPLVFACTGVRRRFNPTWPPRDRSGDNIRAMLASKPK
jgi:hypothetical protein